MRSLHEIVPERSDFELTIEIGLRHTFPEAITRTTNGRIEYKLFNYNHWTLMPHDLATTYAEEGRRRR